MGLWLDLTLACAQATAPAARAPSAPTSEQATKGAQLVVFVADEAGALLVAGWRVRVGSWAGNELRWQLEEPIDPVTGTATFDGLAGATCVVEALHATQESGGREQIVLAPEGTTVHEVAFSGPRPERALIVDVTGALGAPLFDTPRTPLFAIDRLGREHELTPHPDRAGRYIAYEIAEHLSAGPYRIETRDPRFAPRVLDAHVAGVAAQAALMGTVTLVVRFVDADDRTPLTPLVCTKLEMFGTADSITAMTSSKVGPTPRAEGGGDEVRLPGLFAGHSVSLVASFAEHVDTVAEVADLVNGEVRVLEWPVARGRVVAGDVVDPSGVRIAGVPLVTTLQRETLTLRGGRRSASLPAVPGWAAAAGGASLHVAGSSPSPSASATRVLVAGRITVGASAQGPPSATSDAAGRFRLVKVTAETKRVYAVLSPWHLVTEPLDGDTPVRVTALGPGAAEVQVVLPQDVDLSAFDFAFQVGDGPWLTQPSTPLVDERSLLTLRGMPLVPCRLRVTPRASQGDGAAPPPERVLELAPSAGPPTRAVLDLTDLLPTR